MSKCFVKVVTDQLPNNPIITDKIEKVGKEQAAAINESCKKGIDLVNAHIEKVLGIPDNVILYRDKLFAKEVTEQQLKDLECEVEGLKMKVKENSIYLNCLKNELSTYEEAQKSIGIEQAYMNIAKDFLNKNLFDTAIIENYQNVLGEK